MWALAAAVVLLAARNIAGESLVPSALYVPVNVAAIAVLAVIAALARLSADDLGLALSKVPAGLRVGGAVAVSAVALIALAAAVPVTQPFFEDRRLAGVDGVGELAYQALVRVPVGTALFEEFAFRGVLLGLVARHRSTTTAVVVSSVLFGLWHIRPTLGALDSNDLADEGLVQVGAIAAAVVVTAVAGAGFCALRLMSRSLLAPLLVHASINSAATVAAYLVLQSQG